MREQIEKLAVSLNNEAEVLLLDTLVSMNESIRNEILAEKYKEIASELQAILDSGTTCAELCGVDVDKITEVESKHPFVAKQGR